MKLTPCVGNRRNACHGLPALGVAALMATHVEASMVIASGDSELRGDIQ
ncbi:MAG: hypothetical protein OEM63_11655 [Gammaproteobacteria bacterium]|nr:hypothetical protein [Gammaproteobacteria bacterium]